MWSIFETKKRRLADFLQGFRKNIKKVNKFDNFLFKHFFPQKVYGPLNQPIVPPPLTHLETLEVTQREAEALEGRPGGILIRSDGVIHSGTFQILGKSLEIGTVYHSRTLYIQKPDIFSDKTSQNGNWSSLKPSNVIVRSS